MEVHHIGLECGNSGFGKWSSGSLLSFQQQYNSLKPVAVQVVVRQYSSFLMLIKLIQTFHKQ